ncbi:hypothetical protein ECANGB1_2772 [Enterospora canceri]|uniref:Palmitoyltransferase n=1 Tax=Enterospora canceri TaxID=1081671 RepID=A0A1Y1S9I6_9MICR|nr:hypothetical protein ECANGB1_2772 [Enterospora canceri]
MKCIENKEKLCRLIAYGALLFIGAIPSLVYIRKESGFVSEATMVGLSIVAAFGAFYATICIFTDGFVDRKVHFTIPREMERKCTICDIVKPERSHHCKICKKCVVKMDHHCNILSVCIGHSNHGHFVRYLFFTWLGALWLFLYNAFLIFNKIFIATDSVTYPISTFILFSTLVSICIIFITTMHLHWQTQNMRRNITNIELVQEHNAKYRDIKCGPSPYNQGFYSNFRDIMGSIRYLHLGPPVLDGYNWPKTFKTYYWPLIDVNAIRSECDENI